jgi:phosphoribosylformylglycinamidine cyclo-ligase
MSTARSEHYTRAGVNIDAADALIERIKPLADATRVPGATAGLGGFGGIFDLAAAGFPGAPRLVAGTDGVGTKLKVAFAHNKHNTIGIDCVAMCVNDILACGAKPLFFLDYFATGALDPHVGGAVVAGIAEGCRQAQCWLLGGETAEMRGVYHDGEYDIAGFVVGAVTDETEIRVESTRAGDVVIGVASSGLHSNGFSLVRRVLLEDAALPLDAALDGDEMTLGDRLLVPTTIYVRLLEAVRNAGVAPHAIAHITGGGLWENPQRSVDTHLCVSLDIAALRTMRQPIFELISRIGAVPEREMYRVFNMGVGLTITVAPSQVDAALAAIHASGHGAAVIGTLVPKVESRVTIDGISESPIGA